ncbi:hypothetical protein, partial [Rothia nasisuis]|uniref:hypothetical protein n=1 Tax=Rothia nasisuis TaxID=2109647 RepID=UPI001F23C5E5
MRKKLTLASTIALISVSILLTSNPSHSSYQGNISRDRIDISYKENSSQLTEISSESFLGVGGSNNHAGRPSQETLTSYFGESAQQSTTGNPVSRSAPAVIPCR